MIADWIYTEIFEPILTFFVAAFCVPLLIIEYLKRC